MAQDASARPMLFNAFGCGSLACIGYPLAFPSANNIAKFNQSIQNREIIGILHRYGLDLLELTTIQGLYSPRRPHHGVTSPSRMRRGHYDRGNTYDLQEQQAMFSSYPSTPFRSPRHSFGL